MGLKDLFKKRDPRFTNLKIFIGLALIDGKFTAEEKYIIDVLARKAGLTSKDVDFCLRHPDRIKVKEPKTYEEKISCLSGMIMVMLADGVADPKEIKVVRGMAEIFGIDPSVVDVFISKNNQ